MKTPQFTDIKEKSREYLDFALAEFRQSSWTARLVVVTPVLAGVAFAALTVSLNIFLRYAPRDHYLLDFLAQFGLLITFFAPLTFVTVKLYQRLRPRIGERRFKDALLIGLYLPHAFATLIILISQLEGSQNITSLGAAIITWAMLSLLLTPFSALLSLLVWSYLPKEIRVPDLLQITSRLNSRGQNLLTAPKPAADDDGDAVRT
ncbi:MAG: hypothetical protein K9G33_16790 [Sneathiella sp.]|nr:hypothetical protein [Sneathiella sp.]